MASNKRQVRTILRRAAKLIELGDEHKCCSAIVAAAEKYDCQFLAAEASEHFALMFSPFVFSGPDPSYPQWGSAAKFWNKDPTPTRQRQRVDALLLAAASYEG